MTVELQVGESVTCVWLGWSACLLWVLVGIGYDFCVVIGVQFLCCDPTQSSVFCAFLPPFCRVWCRFVLTKYMMLQSRLT
jgi:hypothetical protein